MQKIIMYLERDSGSGGFCAEWVYWLNRLSFSDKMGFKHCINWTDSQFYKESELENNNIFEYFFEQPANISVEDAVESQNVIFDYNTIDYGYYDFLPRAEMMIILLLIRILLVLPKFRKSILD